MYERLRIWRETYWTEYPFNPLCTKANRVKSLRMPDSGQTEATLWSMFTESTKRRQRFVDCLRFVSIFKRGPKLRTFISVEGTMDRYKYSLIFADHTYIQTCELHAM